MKHFRLLNTIFWSLAILSGEAFLIVTASAHRLYPEMEDEANPLYNAETVLFALFLLLFIIAGTILLIKSVKKPEKLKANQEELKKSPIDKEDDIFLLKGKENKTYLLSFLSLFFLFYNYDIWMVLLSGGLLALFFLTGSLSSLVFSILFFLLFLFMFLIVPEIFLLQEKKDKENLRYSYAFKESGIIINITGHNEKGPLYSSSAISYQDIEHYLLSEKDKELVLVFYQNSRLRSEILLVEDEDKEKLRKFLQKKTKKEKHHKKKSE